jgi:hypothetical protein
MENKQEDSVREAISLREPVPIIIEERVRHSASRNDVRNGSVVLSAMMLIYIAAKEDSMAGDISGEDRIDSACGRRGYGGNFRNYKLDSRQLWCYNYH